MEFLSLLLRINWKYVAVLAVIVALIAVYVKLFAVVLLLVAMILVSVFINYFHLRMLGIELVTFATVILGIAYGPAIGAVVGLVFVLISLVFSGYFGIYYLWVVPQYAIVGYLVSGWADQNIVSLGLNITIALQILNLVLTYLFDRYSFFSHIIYSVTNIIFNFIIFALFGQMVLSVLG